MAQDMIAETELETMLLGPVLAERDCGSCTVCCTVLTVNTPEFSKAAGSPCTHLTPQGCGIHAERPPICRSWFCVWRRLASLPDDARPDRSGLLVSLNFVRAPRNCLEAVSINIKMLPGSSAIEDGMAKTMLDALCGDLVPVWFSDGSRKMLMHPEPEVARLVLSGEPALAPFQDEVAAWRARYGLFAADGEP
jgi:hypothetical protein